MSYGLQVKVVEARNLKAADTNAKGLSDPYCLISLGSSKARTRVVKKTLSPRWNQTFRLEIGKDTEFKLTCWDKDTFSQDDFLGQFSVDMKDMWFPLKPRKGDDGISGEILLQFSVVPLYGSGGNASSPLHDEADDLINELGGRGGDDDEAGGEDEFADFNSGPARAALVKSKVGIAGSSGKVQDKIEEMTQQSSKELDISSMRLSGVPRDVLTLNFLTHLNAGFNEITEFPNLTPLQSLEYLDLSGNKIAEVNASVASLVNLRELLLRGNQLSIFAMEIADCKELVKLDLANNHITSVPPELGKLKKLEELYMQGNNVGTVPQTIGNLNNMEILDLSGCQVVELPEEFTYQTKLIELNLGNNNLRVLPASFGRLTRLASINLSDNQLNDLPMSMGFCGGVTSIQIDGNQIRSQEMVRKYVSDLTKYHLGADHLVDFLEKRLMSYKVKTGSDLELLLFGSPDENKSTGPKPQEEEVVAEATPEQKFQAMRLEARGICQDLLLHLTEVRKDLMRTTQLSDCLKYAQMMRRLKPDVDAAHARCPGVAMPTPPILHAGEDKLIAFQKTVNGAIKETEAVLQGLQKAMGSCATAPDLIPFIRLIKPLKAGLGL